VTYAHDIFSGISVFASARHLASFYVLIGLLSNNSGPTCLDLRASNEVDPFMEDRDFLVEQADHL